MRGFLAVLVFPALASQIGYRDVPLAELSRRAEAVVVATAESTGAFSRAKGRAFRVVRTLGESAKPFVASGSRLLVWQGGTSAMERVREAQETRRVMISPVLDRLADRGRVTSVTAGGTYVLFLSPLSGGRVELAAADAALQESEEPRVVGALRGP